MGGAGFLMPGYRKSSPGPAQAETVVNFIAKEKLSEPPT